MIEPYTVAITSCGRFDLLERTLASLIPVLEGPVEKIVIIEDSGLSAITEVVSKFNNVGGGIAFILIRLSITKNLDKLNLLADSTRTSKLSGYFTVKMTGNFFVPVSSKSRLR